jgi:uncharacterized protein (DUF4415 family)
MSKSSVDPDTAQLMRDIEQGLQEAKAGQGRVNTPEQITARRRGRPVGSVQAATKEPVKIRLDADVLAALKASGDGWQTRINDALRASLVLSGALK